MYYTLNDPCITSHEVKQHPTNVEFKLEGFATSITCEEAHPVKKTIQPESLGFFAALSAKQTTANTATPGVYQRAFTPLKPEEETEEQDELDDTPMQLMEINGTVYRFDPDSGETWEKRSKWENNERVVFWQLILEPDEAEEKLKELREAKSKREAKVEAEKKRAEAEDERKKLLDEASAQWNRRYKPYINPYIYPYTITYTNSTSSRKI